MSRYSVSPAARQDLREIYRHIAKDNRVAAVGVVDRLIDTFSLLASQPEMGTVRLDLVPGVQSFSGSGPARNYVIFYRIGPSEIEIVRVIHGARDDRNVLE